MIYKVGIGNNENWDEITQNTCRNQGGGVGATLIFHCDKMRPAMRFSPFPRFLKKAQLVELKELYDAWFHVGTFSARFRRVLDS